MEIRTKWMAYKEPNDWPIFFDNKEDATKWVKEQNETFKQEKWFCKEVKTTACQCCRNFHIIYNG